MSCSAKKYCSGDLRHSVTIETETLSSNSMGGHTRVWSTFATVLAGIYPMSAKERFFANKTEHDISHKVVIRYLSGVKAKMRIMFNGRKLLIDGTVNPEEKNEWLEIACIEKE